MLPFLHESKEIFQNPTKLYLLYLSSKSTVILSRHPKSTQIRSNLSKSAQIHPNSSNSQKRKQLQLNSPYQIQKVPNLFESTPIYEIVEIVQNPPKSIKADQIHQNQCKSTRVVLNPVETTNIYPNKPKPNSIVKLQRNLFKHVSIHLRRTHLPSNHKIARFRQRHKQLQITQNSQHLI